MMSKFNPLSATPLNIGEENTLTAVSGDIIELNGFEVHRLSSEPHVIRVLSGCGWITVKGRDLFVPRGEEIFLHPDTELAIISSPNARAVVFEILPVD